MKVPWKICGVVSPSNSGTKIPDSVILEIDKMLGSAQATIVKRSGNEFHFSKSIFKFKDGENIFGLATHGYCQVDQTKGTIQFTLSFGSMMFFLTATMALFLLDSALNPLNSNLLFDLVSVALGWFFLNGFNIIYGYTRFKRKLKSLV